MFIYLLCEILYKQRVLSQMRPEADWNNAVRSIPDLGHAVCLRALSCEDGALTVSFPSSQTE